MNKARLEQLLVYLKEDPNDPFHWYAIGNEYRTENPKKALEYLGELRSRFPGYLPTYYVLAELYASLEENLVAEEVYKEGIALAEKLGELKPLAELKNAYQNFLFELD
ncbi:MAG TPA: enzyme of heme biosynthesis [Cytophagales bacterium]|nr:enzyme of heme biosynthesis [Cytophagales bacterium]HAA19717.1 enzyme of heme biosynthesis [Cytophagales bacterium]HAP61621.1 enzyme of heme biosynthesis [Cytophagales bacterium]